MRISIIWGLQKFLFLCSPVELKPQFKKLTAAHPYSELHPVTSLEALFYPAWCMLQTAIPGSVGLSAIYTWTKSLK